MIRYAVVRFLGGPGAEYEFFGDGFLRYDIPWLESGSFGRVEYVELLYSILCRQNFRPWSSLGVKLLWFCSHVYRVARLICLWMMRQFLTRAVHSVLLLLPR